MTFPTYSEIERADKLTLGRWVVDLPFASNCEELDLLQEISDRFTALGGFDLRTIEALFPAGVARLNWGGSFGSMVANAAQGA